MTLPERHLGLVQAGELSDLETRLDEAATVLEQAGLGRLPAPVNSSAPPPEPVPALLAGCRIGIARDAAFAFLYPANLDLLRAMGAELVFFLPLADSRLPSMWMRCGCRAVTRNCTGKRWRTMSPCAMPCRRTTRRASPCWQSAVA